MVRGRGYIKSLKDLEDISVGTDRAGTPVFLKQIGTSSLDRICEEGLLIWMEKVK